MMEQGTIVSSEILPKVAKEFAKAARQGGALGEALKTVRVQQGKFLTQSQKSQNTIFKSGFGEGLSTLYQTLIQNLKELEPILKVVGKLFSFLFKTIAAGLNMLLAPVKVISDLTGAFGGLDEAGSKFAENTIPKLVAAGGLMLTAWGRVLAKFLAIKAVLEELVALSTKGVVAQVERDIGRDIGFDFGIGGDSKKTSNPSFSSKATSADKAFNYLNSEDRFSAFDWLKSNVLDTLGTEIKVTNNPVIDHSGGLHIETAIERSIANGQAQR